MWTAYLFTVICFIGLGAILGWLPNTLYWIIMWLTSSFLSLTILPIIMVGQNILGRKSEMQADEQFKTTQKTYHDIEETGKHLSAQDDELLSRRNCYSSCANMTDTRYLGAMTMVLMTPSLRLLQR